MANNEEQEEIWINNIRLDVNPVNIVSRQKRRLVTEEYIREVSASAHAGKYGEASFTIILQFNVEEMLYTPMSPTNPPKLAKLIAQLDNYPFVFIRSERLRTYITPTANKEISDMIFGIDSFSIALDSSTNNIVTVVMNIRYFNHSPLSKDASYVAVDAIRGDDLPERTRIIRGKPQTEYIKNTTSLAGSSIFNSYFIKDYAYTVPRLLRYTDGRAIGSFDFMFPLFTDTEPEGDSEEIIYTEIDDKNKVYRSTAYAQWNAINGISQINKASSPVTGLRITRKNNFASHTLTAWTYPTLQYMGKGTTEVSFSMTSNSINSNTLIMIKHMLSMVDENQKNFPKYTASNVIKMDNILFDLLPVYGVIFDQESIVSSSEFQDVDVITMAFKEKNVRPLLDRKAARHATNRSGSYSMEMMIEILLAISENSEGELEGSKDISLTDLAAGRPGIGENDDGIRSHGTIDHHKDAVLPSGVTDEFLTGLERQHGLDTTTLYNVMYQESRAWDERGAYINPNAVNASSGAVGAFQFLKATGEQYGLYDRTDPKASAIAAAKYLDYLKKRFGSTEMALAAYNWGEGNLKKAIESHGLSLSDVQSMQTSAWPIVKGDTPKETQDYVPAISSGIRVDGKNLGEYSARYIRSDVDYATDSLGNLANGINDGMRTEDKGYDLSGNQDSVANTLRYVRAISRHIDVDQNKSLAVAKQSIEQTFLNLLSQAEAGNGFLASHMGIIGQSIYKQIDRLDNAFTGEAYTDLELGERTLGYGPVVGEDGEVTESPRDINPMFFMYPNAYITESLLGRGFRTVMSRMSADKKTITEEVYKALVVESNIDGKIETYGRVSSKSSSEDKLAEELKKIKIGKVFDKISPELDPGSIQYMRGTFPLDMEQQGPEAESAQAKMHFKRSSDTFSRGINLAFPVIKVYIVDGDEDTLRSNIANPSHGYYELSGLIAAKIVGQDDDSPVDFLYLKLANPGSVYTDSTVTMDELHPKKNWDAVDTNHETSIPLNRIAIRPGSRLHVKAGYSNDVNRLETMFNGIVTEVSGELTLQIQAESFGRELISYEHGDDPTSDEFAWGADTAEIITNFIYSSEIEHFGNIKFRDSLRDREGDDRVVFTVNNIFKYVGSQALFVNIFLDNVIHEKGFLEIAWDKLNIFNDKPWWPHFPVYKTTPWSAFKEMEYRHPGSLARACNYGDRQTLFFGVKEQLYVYRDLNDELQSHSATAEIYDQFRDKRLKPVSDFHILSSDLNIIYNGLRVTSDFNTVVSVRYFDDSDDIKSGDFEWYDMKMDDNLKPMAHRLGRCEMLGVNGEFAAYSYGSTYLRKEAEKMYDGKIMILGNQNVKSGDYAILDDSTRGINGIIKIRECIHHFDINNGYVTEIRPGLMAESTHIDYSMLFTKLYLGYMPIITAARAVASISAHSDEGYTALSTLLQIASSLNSAHNPTEERFFSEEALIETAATGIQAAIGINALSSLGSTISNSAAAQAATTAGRNIASSASRIGSSLLSQFSRSSASTALTSYANGAVRPLSIGSGAGEALLARSKMMSSSIIRSGGRLVLGTLSGPVTIAGALLIALVSARVEEEKLTRQPVRLFPLSMNGKPYIGGIWGYHTGGYIEDKLLNISTTWDNTVLMASAMWRSI